jgi:hypothetical protein
MLGDKKIGRRPMAVIFQYGSNMSTPRLNGADRLCGAAKPIGIAKTSECYELDFTVWSEKSKCAAADIVPGYGRNIWGVLYDIPDSLISRTSSRGRKSLDAIEGEGTNYLRTEISLVSTEGNQLHAITYVAKNRQANLKTSLIYVRHILDGIQEHNLPEEYARYVLARIVENNSALKDDLKRLYRYVA